MRSRIDIQIMVVQETFGKVFNEGTEFQRDGSQFDALFNDGDTYKVGNMQAVAIYTPCIVWDHAVKRRLLLLASAIWATGCCTLVSDSRSSLASMVSS